VSTDQVVVVLDDARLGAPFEVGVLTREGRGATEVVRFSYSDAMAILTRSLRIWPSSTGERGSTSSSATATIT
jgi:hypothetical protein